MTAGNYRIIALQAEGERHIRLNAGASDLPSRNTRKEAKMAAAGLPNAPETVIVAMK